VLYEALSTLTSSDAIGLLKTESAPDFPAEEVFNGFI
jgi:hypothetical protein